MFLKNSRTESDRVKNIGLTRPELLTNSRCGKDVDYLLPSNVKMMRKSGKSDESGIKIQETASSSRGNSIADKVYGWMRYSQTHTHILTRFSLRLLHTVNRTYEIYPLLSMSQG